MIFMKSKENYGKTAVSRCFLNFDGMVNVFLCSNCDDFFILYASCFLVIDHVCMVFETLGSSLYDIIKKNEYKGLPLFMVRDISRQLLQAMSFLKSVNLIHTGKRFQYGSKQNVLLMSLLASNCLVDRLKIGKCALCAFCTTQLRSSSRRTNSHNLSTGENAHQMYFNYNHFYLLLLFADELGLFM